MTEMITNRNIKEKERKQDLREAGTSVHGGGGYVIREIVSVMLA
jgi:hypothetical protein